MKQRGKRPCLKSKDGTEIQLPEPIFDLLVKVIEDMRNGRSIVLLPEEETFTTQAAANFLGMSRQHLVDLLGNRKIPFHCVGSHRRIIFRDLREFEKQRDTQRHKGLKGLFKKVSEASLHEQITALPWFCF